MANNSSQTYNPERRVRTQKLELERDDIALIASALEKLGTPNAILLADMVADSTSIVMKRRTVR
jgi:hypothetical protein